MTLQEAPTDDEPLTAEDLAALEEAERDWQEGKIASHRVFFSKEQGGVLLIRAVRPRGDAY